MKTYLRSRMDILKEKIFHLSGGSGKFSRKIHAAAFLLTWLWTGLFPAYGDIFWESEQVVTGDPDHPPKKKYIRHYLTSCCSRMDIGENVMIADFCNLNGFVLQTADKMYLEMQMNNVGKIPEGLTEEIRVTPTRTTKRIAGYICRKYRVSFMNREYEQWLSKDVRGYRELKRLNDRLTDLIRRNPLFQMGIVGRMDRLDGFPVRMIMPMDGGLTKIVTLKRVSEKNIDASVFQVPEGFKAPYE